MTTMSVTAEDIRRMDAEDPLGKFRDEFVPPADPGLVAYLDGNSLGRPPRATASRLAEVVAGQWGSRLIRSWSEGWMELPQRIGDRLAAATLGAAGGQVVIADSTSVCLYKALRAATALRPGRDEIVTDRGNFPTDSYVLAGVAEELGMTVRWIESDPAGGVRAEQVAGLVGAQTALVTLSHVAYRSAYIADLPAITQLAHAAGALVVWDLCHSVGSVPLALDADGVDLAVGCTYKYLNAGPGAPAFLYVRREHQDGFRNAVPGWIGHADPFAMQPGYRPAPGVRRALSGTPGVLGLVGVDEGVAVVERAGIGPIRDKAVALTELVVALADEWLAPHGVAVGSPRNPDRRGAHVLLVHPDAARRSAELINRGVLVDHRPPGGIRVGLSPLTTSYAEVWAAMQVIRDVLRDSTSGPGAA
jgi:kynureninase